MPRVCLYVTGEPGDQVRSRHGTFVDWFRPLFAAHEVAVEPFDATTGRLPDGYSDYDAVVITGSPASVTQPEVWMEAAVEWIRQAHGAGQPVLGVCFGHQLIAAAFGASIIRNPAGLQLGTFELAVEPGGLDDPLFAGLPERFEVNFVHEDTADAGTVSARNGVRVLASSPRARVAAIAAGAHIRGVQFHPEVTGAINRANLEAHRADVDRDHERGIGAHPDDLRAGMRDTPLGAQVFHNFIEHHVKAGR